MKINEIIKWLEFDLEENRQILKGLEKETATEKTQKGIKALETSIRLLKEGGK